MSKTTEKPATWQESLEFGFRDVNRIDAEIKRARQDFEDFLELKQKEKAEIEAKFGFMRRILVGTDDESVPESQRLSTSVKAALNFVGFDVVDVDGKIREAIDQDAWWVKNGDFSALTHVVETEQKSPELGVYAGLLGRMVTILQRRELLKKDSEGLEALLIVNHDRSTSPFERPKLYADNADEIVGDDIVEAAADHRIGLLSTVELYRFVMAVKDSVLSKEEAQKSIKKPGRIEFPKK